MSRLLDEVLAAHGGHGGLRRNIRWDALDAAYFAGYAWWNYLSAPLLLLLTRDGVTVIEAEPWLQDGEQRRRRNIRFPPDLHTHSPRFRFGETGTGAPHPTDLRISNWH